MKKRLLACLLTAAMLVSLFPLPALAAEAEPYTEGLCHHHQEHSYEVCGYVEAVEGQPCGHVHDGACGFVEAVPEVPCDMDCAEIDVDSQIVHAEDCAYAPEVEAAPCQHEHYELCGYKIMLNHIVMMGRLTRDPELRHTQAGTAVASFTVAVDRDFKDKETGERKTDFIDCVAWRSTGEFVAKYFAKGRMAVVEGRLQLRDWTDKEGNKRRSAEILASSVYFGDSKPKDGGSTGGKAGKDDDFQLPGDFGAGSDNGFADMADDDGDLPF